MLYADTGPSGLRVTACCRAAAAAGVRPGMRVAEAEGLWPPKTLRGTRGPQFVPHDVDADQEALVRLAEWCQRFTPLVGIEGTDSLRLDVTGCAHLFGGEWGLARRVLHDFRRCGLRVQVGLADTLGAAWAVAHHGAGGWHDLRAAVVVAADSAGDHSRDRLAESRRRPPAIDQSDDAVVGTTRDQKKIANCKLHNANCKFEQSEPPGSARRTAGLNAATHQQSSHSENSICNSQFAICNLQSSAPPLSGLTDGRSQDHGDESRGSKDGGDKPRRSPVLRSERNSIRIVPPGQQQHALNALPVEALRLPPDATALLHTLSLRRIGQVLDLPRSTLPARFGPQLLQRIDQALGRVAEPIVAVRPRPPVSAHWTLPAPTADRCALGNAVGRLIRQIAEQLAARREGVQKLEVRFTHPAAQATNLTVGTVQPTAAWQHLLNLALTQLERIQLRDEVLSLAATAERIAPLPSHQPQLLESAQPQKNRRALAQLADRLSTRLGKDHVVQPVLHADPQPELAVHWQQKVRNASRLAESRRRPRRDDQHDGSIGDTAVDERKTIANCKLQIANLELNKSDGESFVPNHGHHPPISNSSICNLQSSSFCVPRTAKLTPSARPLQLLPEPEPIEVDCTAGSPVRVARGGRVHHVAACCGPERIETGWWRGADVQRDYFRLDTAEGLRLWIFRRIEQQDWFLHGEFD